MTIVIEKPAFMSVIYPCIKKTIKMPIKSYLAHPHQGKKMELYQTLSGLSKCEVIPAENKDLLILVTDTDSSSEEDRLQEKLQAIDSMKLLAMVSGFNTTKN